MGFLTKRAIFGGPYGTGALFAGETPAPKAVLEVAYSSSFGGAKRRARQEMGRRRQDGGDPRELALARVSQVQRRIGTAEAVPFHSSAQSSGCCTASPPCAALYSNLRNALDWDSGVFVVGFDGSRAGMPAPHDPP